MPFDHADARSHDARELEHADTRQRGRLKRRSSVGRRSAIRPLPKRLVIGWDELIDEDHRVRALIQHASHELFRVARGVWLGVRHPHRIPSRPAPQPRRDLMHHAHAIDADNAPA